MSGIDPSVHGEPHFQEGQRRPDPSEWTAERTSEPRDAIQAARESIHAEPWMEGGGAPAALDAELRWRRGETTRAGDVGVTALAALLGGPAAIVGAFAGSQGGAIGALYVVVLGPFLEEIVKQSGSIYLLERKPWRLFSPWQFVVAGAVAGLGFGLIENLLYFHVYQVPRDPWTWNLRWYGCTTLHVVCSIVGSLGLRRVWRRFLETGGPVDLAPAHPFLLAAILLHAAWNAMAVGTALLAR